MHINKCKSKCRGISQKFIAAVLGLMLRTPQKNTLNKRHKAYRIRSMSTFKVIAKCIVFKSTAQISVAAVNE